jgi:hypothetical protein
MFYGMIRDESRAIVEGENRRSELKMQSKIGDWWKNSSFFRKR